MNPLRPWSSPALCVFSYALSVCMPLPQDLRQLHASAGGGGHDDHGQQARLQVRLHLRTVSGKPPAQIRDVHGSALWPLTCAQWSVTSSDPSPGSIFTWWPPPHVTGWDTESHISGGHVEDCVYVFGVCVRVCVYQFAYYLCWQWWRVFITSVLLWTRMVKHKVRLPPATERQSFYKTSFFKALRFLHLFVLKLSFVPGDI